MPSSCRRPGTPAGAACRRPACLRPRRPRANQITQPRRRAGPARRARARRTDDRGRRAQQECEEQRPQQPDDPLQVRAEKQQRDRQRQQGAVDHRVRLVLAGDEAAVGEQQARQRAHERPAPRAGGRARGAAGSFRERAAHDTRRMPAASAGPRPLRFRPSAVLSALRAARSLSEHACGGRGPGGSLGGRASAGARRVSPRCASRPVPGAAGRAAAHQSPAAPAALSAVHTPKSVVSGSASERAARRAQRRLRRRGLHDTPALLSPCWASLRSGRRPASAGNDSWQSAGIGGAAGLRLSDRLSRARASLARAERPSVRSPACTCARLASVEPG